VASQSVNRDREGPDWPLGLIVVATPGTPVGIMSLVDPNNYNDPSTVSSGSESSTNNAEYTVRAQQIIFQGYKAGASHGLQNNTGNIYIVRKPIQGSGSGYNQDYGSIVAVIAAGQSFVLASAPMDRNVFSPYRYLIDADNASDACLVTLIIQ
jgi:hypothetical protein